MKKRLIGLLLFVVGIFVLLIGMKDHRTLQLYENVDSWNYVIVYGVILAGIIMSSVGFGLFKKK